jgi:NitT/TauT family transport system substrate-binding protein
MMDSSSNPALPAAALSTGNRCLVWITGAALWLLALSFAVQAADPVKVRLVTDWYPQPEHGGFYHALVKGYYKQAGLDVEILPGGPNTFAIQRVATRAGDFGMASTDDILSANDRGIPVVAVGATMQHDPQGIMIHDASPIRDFPDLDGRTIAVGPGTSWLPYLVKRYGLKKVQERAHTYSVGAFLKDPTYIQQCFVTSEPFFATLGGAKPRVLLIKDSGYDPYRVFFTRRDMIQKQPEVVRAFVTASIQGWRDYLDDPADAHAEISRRNPELTPEKMEFSVKALKKDRFVTGDPDKGDVHGQFTAERWKFQFDTLKELGVIRGRFDVTNAWTGTFCNTPAKP